MKTIKRKLILSGKRTQKGLLLKERLSASNLGVLEFLCESYKERGWVQASDIRTAWSWKRFRFEYVVDMEKQKPFSHHVSVHNKSEENTAHRIFSYTDDRGNMFFKDFYYDPKRVDVGDEYEIWIRSLEAQGLF